MRAWLTRAPYPPGREPTREDAASRPSLIRAVRSQRAGLRLGRDHAREADGLLAALAQRPGAQTVVQENDGARMQLRPDRGEHRLGGVAAPVVGVDVPSAQLEIVRGGDLLGPWGLRSERRAPAARMDAEVRERAQRALGVVLDRDAVDVSVAHVLVAVQLDGVTARPDGREHLRMGCRAR